jgi:hypothetical protein
MMNHIEETTGGTLRGWLTRLRILLGQWFMTTAGYWAGVDTNLRQLRLEGYDTPGMLEGYLSWGRNCPCCGRKVHSSGK